MSVHFKSSGKKGSTRSRRGDGRRQKRRTVTELESRSTAEPIIHDNVIDLLGKGMQKIHMERVLDLLSEYLAVEQGGVQLYSLARDRAQSPDIRAALEKFLHQTERHVDLLQRAIRDLGGNQVYISPSAQVQQQRVRGMLDLHVPSRFQQISDIENLMLAEVKDHAAWSFLRSIIPFIEDQNAREVLEAIADTIEDEEDVHVSWARQTLNRLMLQHLIQPIDELSEAA